MKWFLLALLLNLSAIAGAQPRGQSASDQRPLVKVIAPPAMTGLSEADQVKFITDVQEITERLLSPNDPPVTIFIENGLRRVNVESFVGTESQRTLLPSRGDGANQAEYISGRFQVQTNYGVNIFIPTGYFAFAENLNEFAGLISIQLSQMSITFANALAKEGVNDLLKDVPPDKWEKTIEERIEVANQLWGKQKKENDKEMYETERYIEKLSRILTLVRMKASLADHEKKAREFWEKYDVKIKASAEVEERIKASHQAIDRMIKGGFDPWGLISPTERIHKIGLRFSGMLSAFGKKYKTAAAGREQLRETMTLELGFIENYLAYLNTKKFSPERQKFYQEPLTEEQFKLKRFAVGTQLLSFGPLGAETVGITGIVGLAYMFGGTAWRAADSSARWALSLWDTPIESETRHIVDKAIESGKDAAGRVGDAAGQLPPVGQRIGDAIEKLPPVGDRVSEAIDKSTPSSQVWFDFTEKLSAWWTQIWGVTSEVSSKAYNEVSTKVEDGWRFSKPTIDRTIEVTGEGVNWTWEKVAIGGDYAGEWLFYGLGKTWDGVSWGGGKVGDGVSWGGGKIGNGISWVWGKAGDGLSAVGNHVVTPIGEKVVGPAWEFVARDAWGVVRDPIYTSTEFLWGAGWTGAGYALYYALPAYVAYHFARLPYDVSSRRTGWFYHRLLRNLKDQTSLNREMSKWENNGQSVDHLIEMAKVQNELMGFIEDSQYSNLNRTAARILYANLYQPFGLARGGPSGSYRDMRSFQYYERSISESVEKEATRILEKMEDKIKARTQPFGSLRSFLTSWFTTAGGRDHSLRIRLRRQIVRDLTFAKYYETMVVRGELPQPMGSDLGGKVEADRETYNAKNRALYNLLGLPAYLSASHNVHYLVRHLDMALNNKDLTQDQRIRLKETLVQMRALHHLSPQTRELFIEVLTRHVPELKMTEIKNLADLKARILSKSLSEEVYRLKVLSMSQERPVDSASAMDMFVALQESGFHRQALVYMTRHLALIGSKPDKRFSNGIEMLVRNLTKPQGPIWVRTWLKYHLFTKIMTLANPVQRLAAYSGVNSAGHRRPFILSTPLGHSLDFVMNRFVYSETHFPDLMTKLDVLAEFGTSPSEISDMFLAAIKRNKNIIVDMDDIRRVLNSPHLFKGLNQGDVPGLTKWEKEIYDRYLELAKKYPSYSFDPIRSEEIQSVLLKRFYELSNKPSLIEQLEFWRILASKGTTGLSDELFERLYGQIQDPALKISWSRIAVEEGLVWDKNIRSEMFKSLVEDRFTPQRLDADASAIERELFKRVQVYLHEGSVDKGLVAVQGFISENFIGIPGDNKKYIDEFLVLVQEARNKIQVSQQRLNRLPAPNLNHRALQQAALKRIEAEQLAELQAALGKNRKRWHNAARLRVIQNGRDYLVEAFPEGGHALLVLINWMSERFQTKQTEAYFVRDYIVALAKEKEKDLGYSVINDLVNQVAGWQKPDKLHFILWLRGSREVPPGVAKMLRRMGPETLRRLYATLPIEVRHLFIGLIINSPKNPLLSGLDRFVYYEQIFDELLPRGKLSAEIAREMLQAFLETTRLNTHERMKNVVVSFLLANHNEGGSNVGVVIRNVLEYYGVVGIKLGQILAGSDILPDEIRNELKKLRDTALAPFRHQIFERLQDILKVKNIDSKFRVLGLLGSASVKYAILVEAPNGDQHVIQIKREEALQPLASKFKQLREIIDFLVKRNPARYAFLKGMVEATISAILQEISLPRESIKTTQAKAEYERIFNESNSVIKVPDNTNLVENLKGSPDDRFHHMRSSEYVSGQTIDKFPIEVQKVFARGILNTETKRFYGPGEPGQVKNVDLDRHFGNTLHNISGEGALPGGGVIATPNRGTPITVKGPDNIIYQYYPIDFGQEREFFVYQRALLHELMAAAQILEYLGPLPSVVQKLITDFKIEVDPQEFTKALAKIFPNRSGPARSSMQSYYSLLYQMEGFGFEGDIFYYEFIKGIYQLEGYEEILRGEKFNSPKKMFAKAVKEAVIRWQTSLNISTKERAIYALRHPRLVHIASANYDMIKEGTLYLDNLLKALEVSTSTRKSILDAFSKVVTKVQTGEQFLEFIKDSDRLSKLSKKDKNLILRWIAHPHVQVLNSSVIPVEDFFALSGSNTVLRAVSERKETNRRRLAPPVYTSFVSGVSTVYAGELVNMIFWSIWDRDPAKAFTWLMHMQTLSKHLGFAAFAVTTSFTRNLANRFIPMSFKVSRFVSMHGVSMGAGMMAQDLVSRILNGQSMDQIIEQMLTQKNLKEVGFAVLTFMAAEEVIKGGEAGLVRLGVSKLPGIMCSSWFAKAGRMGLVFIGAYSADRVLRKTLVEDLQILDQDTFANVERLKLEYDSEVEALEAKTFRDLHTDFPKFFKEATGYNSSQIIQSHNYDGEGCYIYVNNDGKLKNPFAALQNRYKTKLQEIAFNTDDVAIADMIQLESERRLPVYGDHGRLRFESSEVCDSYNSYNGGQQ